MQLTQEVSVDFQHLSLCSNGSYAITMHLQRGLEEYFPLPRIACAWGETDPVFSWKSIM